MVTGKDLYGIELYTKQMQYSKGRHITHIFHSQNKTTIKRYGVCSTREYTILEETFNNSGKGYEFKNLSPGLYAFKVDAAAYMIALPNALSGNDKLVLENKSSVYAIMNGKKKNLIPYEMSASFTSKQLSTMLQAMFEGDSNANYLTINNSIDGYMDMIAVSGLTTLSKSNPTPYHPVELMSLGSFDIESVGITTDQKSKLTINLNNNIKKLPCGKSDLFIMDCVHKEAYIIYRVGRVILTGSEDWKTIKETSKYCIYFYPFNLINSELENGATISNYFPSETYTNIISNDDLLYGICNSIDKNNPGIYIKVPTDVIAEIGVSNFKKYLKYLVNKQNPVIIEYLLKDIKYKSILLDNYDIKQYYPVTNINISADTTAAFFFKTLRYEDDAKKRPNQDHKLQIKI